MSDLTPEEFKKLYLCEFEPDNSFESIKRRVLNTPADCIAKELTWLYAKIDRIEQQLSNSTPNKVIRELMRKADRQISANYAVNNIADALNDMYESLNKLLTNKEEG